MRAEEIYRQIQDKILQLPMNELFLSSEGENARPRSQRMDQMILDETAELAESVRDRVRAEFHAFGPLEPLLKDESITEILINGGQSIWFEREGSLHEHPDCFFSDLSFRNAMDRLCQQAQTHITLAHPSVDAQWKGFRLSLIGGELTKNNLHISLRRHPKSSWTFQRLANNQWASPSEIRFLEDLVRDRKNFLVVGATGSGKTSILNACLDLLKPNERAIAIEDTPEIVLSNKVSMRLVSRQDPQQLLPDIDQAQLVRRSLRLRPDRLVMGEIRGDEAKDFLMALATGHSGSFGTLHASSAAQALIRLEMLTQMGAPQWNLIAIRRLIQLSLDYIVVINRTVDGQRRLSGIHRISSLEDHGFLTEPVETRELEPRAPL